MKGLTKCQAEVLDFIDSFTKEHSYSPTIREISDHCYISVKAADDRITALKRKGFLTSESKKPRTLVITKKEKE